MPSTSEIKLLADECIDGGVVLALRHIGYDISYLRETSPGISDLQAISLAVKESRILLTEDKDFGDLAVRHALPIPGVILLRIAPGHRTRKVSQVQLLFARFADRLPGYYTVVHEDRFRFRSLLSQP